MLAYPFQDLRFIILWDWRLISLQWLEILPVCSTWFHNYSSRDISSRRTTLERVSSSCTHLTSYFHDLPYIHTPQRNIEECELIQNLPYMKWMKIFWGNTCGKYFKYEPPQDFHILHIYIQQRTNVGGISLIFTLCKMTFLWGSKENWSNRSFTHESRRYNDLGNIASSEHLSIIVIEILIKVPWLPDPGELTPSNCAWCKRRIDLMITLLRPLHQPGCLPQLQNKLDTY